MFITFFIGSFGLLNFIYYYLVHEKFNFSAGIFYDNILMLCSIFIIWVYYLIVIPAEEEKRILDRNEVNLFF